MANQAVTLDHLIWEDILNRLTGVTHEAPVARRTLNRTAFDTILAAINATDAAFTIPGMADRKLIMVP